MKKGTRVYYQKLGILLLLLQISIPIVKSVFDQKNKTLWVSNKKKINKVSFAHKIQTTTRTITKV